MKKEKIIKYANRFAIPLQFLACVLVYFLIEWISRHSLAGAWKYMTNKPVIFMYNTLMIFMTSTIVFLFKRRVFMRVLIFGFWIFLGVVNGVLLLFRVTPFTGPDLTLMKDAFKVMKNYMSPVLIILIIAALAAVVGLFVFIGIKAPKYQGHKGKKTIFLGLVTIAASVALFVGSTALLLQKRVLTTYFGNIAFAYQDYGFPYCFSVTVFDTGIGKPGAYSEKLVNNILKKNNTEENAEGAEDVNVIFLQLESFMDPKKVNFLKTSEDPIPYFRELMTEYSSGYLRVPSVGAGTANTEFEAISGMSLQAFGPGEYPYKTILTKQNCESIPYVLKDLGYATHVIHNNEAAFYARNTVFPRLGFDTFTSSEYMLDVSDTTETGWIKDSYLTGEIMNTLKYTEGKDYIYTISVQGHGDYPTEPVVEDPKITVTGAEERTQNNASWEYYVKQLNEIDEFLRELTTELENYDEKVVLVMYGDHLPAMGLKAADLDNKYLFETPYVIWDNFGLEKEDENMTSYQLGAEVLDRIGIHQGTLVDFHQSRVNTKNYQKDLEVLEYDMLYGKQYVYQNLELDPPQEINMQMGIRTIHVDKVVQEKDGGALIKGENFTAASKVEINGSVVKDTEYIDRHTLSIETCPKEGDTICVAQIAAGTEADVLTKTNSIEYKE